MAGHVVRLRHDLENAKGAVLGYLGLKAPVIGGLEKLRKS